MPTAGIVMSVCTRDKVAGPGIFTRLAPRVPTDPLDGYSNLLAHATARGRARVPPILLPWFALDDAGLPIGDYLGGSMELADVSRVYRALLRDAGVQEKFLRAPPVTAGTPPKHREATVHGIRAGVPSELGPETTATESQVIGGWLSEGAATKYRRGAAVTRTLGRMAGILAAEAAKFRRGARAPPAAAPRGHLVGASMRKQFDGIWYDGKVVSWTAPFYFVHYDDGDKEEFTEQDLLALGTRA